MMSGWLNEDGYDEESYGFDEGLQLEDHMLGTPERLLCDDDDDDGYSRLSMELDEDGGYSPQVDHELQLSDGDYHDEYDPQEDHEQLGDDFDPQEDHEQWEDDYDPQEDHEQWGDDFDPQEDHEQWEDDFDPQEDHEQWGDDYDPQEDHEQWGDDFDPQEDHEQLGDDFDPQEDHEQLGDGYDPQEDDEQWGDGYDPQDYNPFDDHEMYDEQLQGSKSVTSHTVPENINEDMHSAGNANSEHLESEEVLHEDLSEKNLITSEAEHLAAVEQTMKKRGTLEHNLSHGVMVGPARSGKSSLMSRLAGEMPSSTSPSTGVAEKVIQVVGVRKSHTVALSVQDTIWYKLLYDQEAIRLMKFAFQNTATPSLADSTASSPLTSIQSEQENVPLMANACESHAALLPEGYVAPMEVFKSATQGKDLELFRQHFENSWSFYLTDTGGQVEFQELLPLLVSGPLVFFFTFRLDQNLEQRFTIEYHLPDGGRSEPYHSTLTVVEAILHTLASISSMGTFTYKCPQVKSVSLKPKMFIIGTHKDKLDPVTADSEIMKVDLALQKVIKATSHYQEDIVQYASESQLIFTVNNFSTDDSDFKEIRTAVNHVVCCSEFRVHFPIHWLIFSLVLRQEMIKDSIISYEQCYAIAKDCGIMDGKELDHALWFLHTKLGLVRHFSTPFLRDFVIRDPQILFDMVTKLIVNTFTFENVRKLRSSKFKKKGIFTLRDVEIVNKDMYHTMVPPKKFLKLLQHLYIVASFQEKGQEKFFMPCVLAHSEDSPSHLSPHLSDIPPLLITFECGYCPKGLPGALITHLLMNKMESKFKWELKTDQIFRNQVSFLVSSCDIITLQIHPTYLELIHSSAKTLPGNTDSELHPKLQTMCNRVRCYVQDGIESISAKMNLNSSASYSLGFYCQNPVCNEKCGNLHPASKVDRDGTHHLWCKQQCGEIVISEPPHGFSVWFENDAYNAIAFVNSGSTYSKIVKDQDHLKICQLIQTLKKTHMIRLGQALGLMRPKLKRLETLPDDMIDAWLREEDYVLETSGPPTWDSLCKALRDIEQNGIARKIEVYASQIIQKTNHR